MPADSITASLNEEQLAAVTAPPDCHQLVLAGAGTGKTRVLTSRFVWLVEKGHSPYSLMAVTFTNRATQEMRERIEQRLGRPSYDLWVGTFHRISLRMLRENLEAAGLPRNFRILDQDDQKRLIKRLLNELNLDDKSWSPKALAQFISTQKENRLRARDMTAGKQLDGTFIHQAQLDLYRAYEKTCEAEGWVDFSEMLLRSYEMLSRDKPLLEKYRRQFTHLLVDEFQDSNSLQYQWLQLLAGKRGYLMAVGDDDQSIYGWRGARVENMEDFLQRYRNVRLTRLEQNYRSTGHILSAANAVISHNQNRIGKALRTDAADGEAIYLHGFADADQEADFILSQVCNWQAQGRRLSAAAVLYRSNAQSRALETACLKQGVPYRIFGGTPFYNRAEVKNALAYMRLLIQPDDNEALLRVINLPRRGLGNRTLEQLRDYASEARLSLWQVCTSEALQATAVSPRARKAISEFSKLITSLQKSVDKLPLGNLAREVIEKAGLSEHYSKEDDNSGLSRLENLDELVVACDAYENSGMSISDVDEAAPDTTPPPNTFIKLHLFLNDIALGVSDASVSDGQDVLYLMTLHSAKGLEFPLVFMAGMEEGIFPHYNSIAEGDIEEERRLCYVGITRAKEQLHMTYALERQLRGHYANSPPSRFLQEIPGHLSVKGDFAEPASQAVAEDDLVGSNVFHEAFGKGLVLAVRGKADNIKVQVQFETVGCKWLMLEYAGLKLL